ncbi:MAG: iron-sulfur cluster assembly scaffold protein [Candidatus Pelagibacter bacterium]|nr:iron-sulfur cluster assembly scaffold protein [Candidatus Pelagibacter bacterium]MBL6861168.1 iron-sulfur cluster assembly scaffold protein [Candidatus Pelagibacter bacterium]
MITSEIIKIASNTSNVGLTNKYTFKSIKKNSICGDIVKIELIINNSKIISMKYETESCVYCEASASLLALKIKNLPVSIVKKELNKFKDGFSEDINFIFSKKFMDFKFLINKNNKKRLNCILLPIETVLKAFK